MINIVFLVNAKRQRQYQDIVNIKNRIENDTDDIVVSILSHKPGVTRWWQLMWLSLNPTLIIDMVPRAKRAIKRVRGCYLKHWHMGDKIKELQLVENAHIPIPKWSAIRPGTMLNQEDWGRYVVVKPSRGRRGANVRIQKTSRVRYKSPEEYPEDHLGRIAPMVAQQFIHTGKWPAAYRVLTFLGSPLFAIRYDGKRDNNFPLDDPDSFSIGGGRSIVANAMGCQIQCAGDPDILELAKQAHGAFPDVPSLGVDILREERTGKLYVIEVNPVGFSWMLSDNTGVKIQEQFGLDFYAQFGAIERASQAAIDTARRLAV